MPRGASVIHVHQITQAVLYRPRRTREDETLRLQVVKALQFHTPVERDELVGKALQIGFPEDPDGCKVFIRDALGIPVDWIASELGVTRDTVQRWKWRGARKLLHLLATLIGKEKC